MAERAETSLSDTTAKDPDSEIVCVCMNMTKRGLRNYLAENQVSFEELLAETGAGQRCTACLLDLEFLFASIRKSGDGGRIVAEDALNKADEPDFLHRIYAFLDRISPQVPLPLKETTTVISGDGIRQSIIVANDSLLYEGKIAAPPMTVSLKVRDSEGRVQHTSRHEVPVGEELRWELSRYLEAPGKGMLGVGSVEIERKAHRLGYRGTTRPQTLIQGRGGSCAVHTQACYGPGEKWFPYYYQADSQRFFVGLFNGTGKTMDFEIGYPLDADDAPGIEPMLHRVVVPPHGARLHEVVLTAETADQLGDRLLRLRCRSTAPGDRKIQFICASPELDRFSIDHPGP